MVTETLWIVEQPLLLFVVAAVGPSSVAVVAAGAGCSRLLAILRTGSSWIGTATCEQTGVVLDRSSCSGLAAVVAPGP